MAGVHTVEEEFLTCAICTEIYSDPCTLMCGHSFCRKCVTQFIKTRPDAIQSKTIPCAFCWQITKVPHPQNPVEDWVKQIKPSLILIGLIDRHQSGLKDLKGKDPCYLCKEVGETTSASSWCSDCEVTLCKRCAKMHTKTPSQSDHCVSELSGNVRVLKRRRMKCRDHKGEIIRFICKGCNKTACQTCCILNHRGCNHVVTIESMVPEIKSILADQKQSLERKMTENLANVRKDKTKIKQLNHAKSTTGSEIKSTVESVIKSLRNKENELLSKLDTEFERQMFQHQASVKSGQITVQMYQQHLEFIDQALQSESEVDVYDMYQVCLSGAVGSMGDTELETRTTTAVGEVTFTPNIEPIRKAITQMGTIDVTFLTRKTPVLQGNTHRRKTLLTPVFHEAIDIQHRNDIEDYASPNDIIVLSSSGGNIVVVTDYNNNSLKSLFNEHGKKRISRLRLSGKPFGIAVIAGHRVAATVSDFRIVVAEVRPELVLISRIKTRYDYSGITSLSDSTLAVSSGFHQSVDILDLSGNVLRSFTAHNTGLKLLQNPVRLSTTKVGNILVSDTGSKSVYCLTSKGDVVFSYQPTGRRCLNIPHGVTTTDSGDIYLADRGSKVIQLTPEGTYVRHISFSAVGMSELWALCFDNADTFYVCGFRHAISCVSHGTSLVTWMMFTVASLETGLSDLVVLAPRTSHFKIRNHEFVG